MKKTKLVLAAALVLAVEALLVLSDLLPQPVIAPVVPSVRESAATNAIIFVFFILNSFTLFFIYKM